MEQLHGADFRAGLGVGRGLCLVSVHACCREREEQWQTKGKHGGYHDKQSQLLTWQFPITRAPPDTIGHPSPVDGPPRLASSR